MEDNSIAFKFITGWGGSEQVLNCCKYNHILRSVPALSDKSLGKKTTKQTTRQIRVRVCKMFLNQADSIQIRSLPVLPATHLHCKHESAYQVSPTLYCLPFLSSQEPVECYFIEAQGLVCTNLIYTR